MALVHIGRRQRADFATDLARFGFSSHTLVVDAQPNLGADEQPPLDEWAQCASCNFREFLAGVGDLRAYPALGPLARFLAHVPELVRALGDRSEPEVARLARQVGAQSCYQLVFDEEPSLPRIPRIVVVGRVETLSLICPGDRVLFEPNRGGVAALIEGLAHARQRGVEQAALGYVRHASAMDHFSDFVEHPSFAEDWAALPARSVALGIGRLGFFMAYPPCATLQLEENRALERVRARMDLSFRRMRHDASLMCPENVSGYTLLSDVAEIVPQGLLPERRLALRFDRLLFMV
jgi:hypothetical protein